MATVSRSNDACNHGAAAWEIKMTRLPEKAKTVYYSGNLSDVQATLEGDFGTDFKMFPERLSGSPELMDLKAKLSRAHDQLLQVPHNGLNLV